MRLVDTDHSLQIDLAGAVNANQLMYTASWEDWKHPAGKKLEEGASDGVSTDATAKDMVEAPAGDIRREITHLSIHNADDTAATVSVILKHDTDLRTVMKVTLLTLETLVYTMGEGWLVLTAGGSHKGAADFALAQGFMLVGNSGGVAAAVDGAGAGGLFVSDGTDVARVALSSHVTMDGAGAVTIAADVVTAAMLASTVAGSDGCIFKSTSTADAVAELDLPTGHILVGTSGDVSTLDFGASAGNILVDSGTAPVSVTMAADATLAANGDLTIAADAINESKVVDSAGLSGLYVKKTALALYDFGTDGGAQGAITLTDAVTIPDNAVVKLVGYEVLTTCADGIADAATVKLNLNTDGDLSTAIAIADAKNPWDAGLVQAAGGAELGAFDTAPTPQKTTGARLVEITVAGGADLTAGKILFEMEYYVSS